MQLTWLGQAVRQVSGTCSANRPAVFCPRMKQYCGLRRDEVDIRVKKTKKETRKQQKLPQIPPVARSIPTKSKEKINTLHLRDEFFPSLPGKITKIEDM